MTGKPYSWGKWISDGIDGLKRLHDGLVPDKPQYDLIKRKNIEWLKDVIERKMELLKPQI